VVSYLQIFRIQNRILHSFLISLCWCPARNTPQWHGQQILASPPPLPICLPTPDDVLFWLLAEKVEILFAFTSKFSFYGHPFHAPGMELWGSGFLWLWVLFHFDLSHLRYGNVYFVLLQVCKCGNVSFIIISYLHSLLLSLTFFCGEGPRSRCYWRTAA
jgi:hypothetical protein